MKNFLLNYGIRGVAFDIDNTLVKTDEYYNSAIKDFGVKLSKFLKSNKSPEDISIELLDEMSVLYAKDNFRPELISKRCLEGISSLYFDTVPQEVIDLIDNEFKDFYNVCPAVYDSTIPVLKNICDLGIKIVLHSHAQEEWTNIKALELARRLETDIPYLATDISKEKDSQSWIDALKLINVNISDSLIIGDNLYSDIVSSLDAGCKNVIWINRGKYGESSYIPKNEDVKITIVPELSNLLSLDTLKL